MYNLLSFILMAVYALSISAAYCQDATEPTSEPANVTPAEEVTAETPASWQYFAPLAIPPIESFGSKENTPPLVELFLGPDVFSHARTDLADLRLLDSSGQTYPYALRNLEPRSVRDPVPATEFNRMETAAGLQELTLELKPENVQHNEIRIVTTGENFRRTVEVDGSDDGMQWHRIADANLLRFADGDKKLDIDFIRYPDSRLRFVRVRVQPDASPNVSTEEKDEFKITEAKVLRSLDIPGDRIQWDVQVGQREPTRVNGSSGSAWIIDLQGQNVPCDRIEFDIEGREFMRDVQIQAEQPYGPLGGMVFSSVYLSESINWQRKLGDPKQPMVVKFPETLTGRLRLLVSDFQNAPLVIRSATASAVARQVVFARPIPPESELRLFFGNPNAELTNYDFARNLPELLDANPARAEIQSIVENPDFVLPPMPFTERFPWLIYVVLSAVVIFLLVTIASIARTAIALHDAERNSENGSIG